LSALVGDYQCQVLGDWPHLAAATAAAAAAAVT